MAIVIFPSPIPIPANNLGSAVLVSGLDAPAGSLQAGGAAIVQAGQGDPTAPGSLGGALSLAAGDAASGANDGGFAAINSGQSSNSGAGIGEGSRIVLTGGKTLNGEGGDIQFQIGTGQGASGELQMQGTLAAFGVAANGQVVNIAGTGPGGAPVTVTNWIPITLDGVPGFVPFAT